MKTGVFLRSHVVLRSVCLLISALVVIASGTIAPAQEYVQVDGTVQWLAGQTLTVALDEPASPSSYMIVGTYIVPVPGPRQTVNFDLSRVRQSEYAFMRPGERVTVIAVVSDDRSRLIATSIIREAGQQAP
jgi:hypothetical protein